MEASIAACLLSVYMSSIWSWRGLGVEGALRQGPISTTSS